MILNVDAPDRRLLSEQVADSILKNIIDNGLQPGDRMPTEPELVEQFGVSRTVIREAGRILVSRGVVDIRPRRGMVVLKYDGQSLSRQIGLMISVGRGSFEQLMEMRLTLEVQMTELAALRRTATEIADITQLADSIGAPGLTFEQTMVADLGFHSAVAKASGNPFFEHVVNPVNEYLRETYSDSLGYESERGKTHAEHNRIAAAIALGDAVEARLAAHDHLTRVSEAAEQLVSKADSSEGQQ
jgi:DNA-binding FadR family transcriptional regulator